MPSRRKKAISAQSSNMPSNCNALSPAQSLIDATPRRRSLRLACCRKGAMETSQHTPVMERQDAWKADSSMSDTGIVTTTTSSKWYNDSDESIDVAEAQRLDEQLDLMEYGDDDDGDERPGKRIKAANDMTNAAASASAPAPVPAVATTRMSTSTAHDEQSEAAFDKSLEASESGASTRAIHLVTDTQPPDSLSLSPHTTGPSLCNKKDKSSLPHNQQAASSPKRSLVMTILPKSEVDSLKSHNSILRSHNLSLARQNAKLRHDNASAILLYQEVQDMGPMDHRHCVKTVDHQRLLEDSNKLNINIVQLRSEHQLMKECSMEWARREILWEVEERLLKTEVKELVSRVGELETIQVGLYQKMKVLETKARIAEDAAEDEHTRATHLEQRLAQAMAHTSCRNGKGAYPEL